MHDLIDSIKAVGLPKHYRKQETLFNAGDKAEGFFYVQSGEIRVYRMDDQGKEIEVVRLGPESFFGEAIVFTSSFFPVFAEAVKDSKVLYFEKDSVFREIEKNPSLAESFISLLARKCVTLNKRIESLGLKTVRQRLIHYLIANCRGSKECLIELKQKKGELAKTLGTISETLSRNLKQMHDEGLIEVSGNKILVKQCRLLKDELL